MAPFVEVPKRFNPFLRFAVWIAEKVTGSTLIPARVLALYPKTAIGAGTLETLAAHKDKNISRRLLKLVRMQTSFYISCPFCIDMNSNKYAKYGISEDEILALRGLKKLEEVKTITERERTALEYARSASQTPIAFNVDLIERVKKFFTDREMVILASTIAQVNFWGRLIQALGIPPAGFSGECDILHLEDYVTLKKE